MCTIFDRLKVRSSATGSLIQKLKIVCTNPEKNIQEIQVIKSKSLNPVYLYSQNKGSINL